LFRFLGAGAVFCLRGALTPSLHGGTPKNARGPQIKAHPWTKVFSKRMPPDAVDLVSKLLQYAPLKRVSCMQAMTHAFFDELRDPATRMPNGRPLPPLFNWLPGELDGLPADLVRRLQPGTAAAPPTAAPSTSAA